MRPVCCAIISFFLLVATESSAQLENVPVHHPVYHYLKRMEVRGLLPGYSSVILPIARDEVARLLGELDTQRAGLSPSEAGWLDDFRSEFRFDISGMAAEEERFLFSTADSTLSLFVNGLLDLDVRRRGGDELKGAHAEFLQAGLRLRGTLLKSLGFYGQATNAQFWGNDRLLMADSLINQSYALHTDNSRNFDFSEGYIRYATGPGALQVGRERLLWGNGAEKLILSGNVPVFDFIRGDFRYKTLRYTFVHGWLLGSRDTLRLLNNSDPTFWFEEPVHTDKYVAAHRIGLSFPGLCEVGFQEIYIYSNRSFDLGYLNPLVLLESVQRSRGERDNGLWAFDATARFIPGLEFYGTLLLDDLHIPGIFTEKWYDKHAYQIGVNWADPLGIPNTLLSAEYTHVEPWMFGHERSRDNTYTSAGNLLGTRIGPNADAMSLRFHALPVRNLSLSGGVLYGRKGRNLTDPSGRIIRNVGGGVDYPHRSIDPESARFLDGNLFITRQADLSASYEFRHQCWLDARALMENEAVTLIVRVRLEL